MLHFFWGERWSQRGFYFTNKNARINVHWIDLFCMRGYTFEDKLWNFKWAWIKMFTLGRTY